MATVALRHVQDLCIAQMADICRECDAAEGGTLFVIGAYGIGKERAFLGTARALGWKIWCEPEKVATMRMLQLGSESMGLLTEVRGAAWAQPAAAWLLCHRCALHWETNGLRTGHRMQSRLLLQTAVAAVPEELHHREPSARLAADPECGSGAPWSTSGCDLALPARGAAHHQHKPRIQPCPCLLALQGFARGWLPSTLALYPVWREAQRSSAASPGLMRCRVWWAGQGQGPHPRDVHGAGAAAGAPGEAAGAGRRPCHRRIQTHGCAVASRHTRRQARMTLGHGRLRCIPALGRV